MQDFSYWQKQGKKPLWPDLVWNIPEQKTGNFTVVGGNAQGFANTIKNSEYLAKTYPVKSVKIILPDATRKNLSSLENAVFVPATDSGSLAQSALLTETLRASDFVIFTGELSKNSITSIAVTNAILENTTPAILTGDAIDAVTTEASQLMMRPGLHLMASMVQLQKFLRALYYPKMLLLSMPLTAIMETLHKFTLSYGDITVVTCYSGQIIVAYRGQIVTEELANTTYTPMSLWLSPLICDVAVMNFFNPKQSLEATSLALLKSKLQP